MISIILPAYNEEKAIKQSIDKINEVMNKIKKYPYEIIVIDDGSNDKTYEHAKKTNAKVIKNPHNLGYGISLKKIGAGDARIELSNASQEFFTSLDQIHMTYLHTVCDLSITTKDGVRTLGTQDSKFVVENKLLFPEGSAIKYICRHPYKNGKEDLLKAIHFIEMIIERDYK